MVGRVYRVEWSGVVAWHGMSPFAFTDYRSPFTRCCRGFEFEFRVVRHCAAGSGWRVNDER